jgi:hypothetical protein
MSTDKTLAEYLKDLANDWSDVRLVFDPDKVVTVLAARMAAWLTSLQPEAEKYITNLEVQSRDAVRQYYLPLWVWHRIDSERWKFSAIPLRESKRGKNPAPEVDHLVAVKLWEQFNTPNEDDDGSDAVDASMIINALGNCSLLEKSFNIAKGATSLSSFLERVHEFKTKTHSIADWCKALDVPDSLLAPSGTSEPAKTTSAAIKERTARMKKELNEYVAGTRQRADI